jgi:hypothetical protein
MRRWICLCSLLLVVGVLMAAAPAPETPKQDRGSALAELLRSPVNFGGFDDPKSTFQEVKESLEDRYGLTIEVNEAAFKNEQVNDVLSCPIVEKPISKAKNMRLDRILRRVLLRVPAPSGATFLVRPDCIEITTEAAAKQEIAGDRVGTLPPLVNQTFDKRALEVALRDVSDATEVSIILDPRAGEKAKAPLTAKFTNTPVDTAVQVLADMAELKMVQLDNVLYVTTRENADKIRAEQEKEAEKNDRPVARPSLRPINSSGGAGM